MKKLKLLITAPTLNHYSGVETFTSTLAVLLNKSYSDLDITVYSPILGSAAERIRETSIKVVENLNSISGADIIIANDNISAIQARNKFPKAKLVFVSHGVNSASNLSQPPSIDLNISLYVAVSEEVLLNLTKNFKIPENMVYIFRNPIDTERFRAQKKPIRPIKNLLVNANNFEGEFKQMVLSVVNKLNLEYKQIGLSLESSSIWDTETEINNADLVISLGRGVLEAMSCERPVIVCGYAGGDGLVTKNNFKDIRKSNFSGRQYNSINCELDLVEEILRANKEETGWQREYIEKEHGLDSVKIFFNHILKLPEPQQVLVETLNEITIYQDEILRLVKNNEYLFSLMKESNLNHSVELNDINCRLRDILDQNDKMINSRGWKALEYLRSVRYPKLFINKNIKVLFKLLKIVLPSQVVNVLRNLLVHLREKKADRRIKHELKGIMQGENPIITVAVPIYDRTTELRESIESVLNQSFQDFELLLITDGSPKETLEVVRDYSNHPKVRVFEFPMNSGNSVRGRNKAIMEARGKYLAFLDSDDICLKDRLRDTVALFEKTNADVVYGGYEFMLSGGRDIVGITDGQKVLPQEFTFSELKKANYLFNSATAVRTELVRNVGGLKTNMRYCEDYELWLRLMNKGAKFVRLNKVVIKYRVHGGNLELAFKEKENEWKELSLKEYPKLSKLPKKIAYILPTTGIGGGVAVVCEHANRLLKKGYDVTFVIDPVYEDSYDLSWFPQQSVPLINIKKASSVYDIAIATGWNTAHTLEIIKAERKIYFVQSDERRFTENKIIVKKISETYSKDFEFMTEAKWIKKWLKEEFNKIAYLVPNAVNENIFFPDVPLVEKSSKLRVLLEGPIDIPFKGMAEAAKVVNDIDCEVWIVSSLGKPKSDWRYNKFFEKVPQAEMRKIYSSCDVLLKLSRVEGFFGPPLEMMACGGTAIVGDVTGYDEYIIDKKNAVVVKLGDLNQAKKAIELLIKDRKYLQSLKNRGLETAKSMNWENSVDILEEIINNKIHDEKN